MASKTVDVLNFPEDMAKHFGEMLETKDNSDVVFVVNGTRFPAHRQIIAAHSEFFKVLLFTNRSKEDEETKIPLEVPLKSFELLLAYFYTGKVELGTDSLKTTMELYELTHRYGVYKLEKKLRGELVSNLTVDGVFDFLNFTERLNLYELETDCLEFIDEKAEEILQREKYLTVDEKLLEKILTRQNLKAKPSQKFEALYKWIKQNEIAEALIQKEILDLIHISKLTNNRISEIPSRESDANVSESENQMSAPSAGSLAPKCLKPYTVHSANAKGEKGSGESCYAKPQTLFNMRETWMINSIDIKLGSANKCYFTVEISIDNQNWTEVYEKNVKHRTQKIKIFVDPQPATYFRITGKFEIVSFTTCYDEGLKFIDGVYVPPFITSDLLLWCDRPKKLRKGLLSIKLRTDGVEKRVYLSQPLRLQYLRFQSAGWRTVLSKDLTVAVIGTNNTVVEVKYIGLDTGSYDFTFPPSVVTAFAFSMPREGRGKTEFDLYGFETGN